MGVAVETTRTAGGQQPKALDRAARDAQPVLVESRPRLLVVDDEAAICRVLERYLSRLGYEVHTTSSAGAAVILLRRLHFSVMISDVRLPDGSGLDLVRQAREIAPHLAVVVFSGQADGQTQRTAFENGAMEFLVKPVPLAEFGLAVERVEARRLKEMAWEKAAARPTA